MKKTIVTLLGIGFLVCVVYYTDQHLVPAKSAAQNVATTPSPASAAQPEAAVPEPNVTFKDLQGNSVKLADLKGKVVWVDFWATWCEPCKIEIPWLIEMQQKYASRGFTVLGVAMDDGGQKVVDPFVKTHKFDVDGQQKLINYPIVIGTDDIADQFGGLVGFPTGYLITRDGRKVKTTMGLVSYDEIAKAIEAQL
jgi:thiol-disulfide isomerase/thioredoxin